MDWSAVWAELPKAIPPLVGAFVGGLLAVTGGVIGGFAGQYFTHRYTRKREAEKLIREKAEQLIQTLYEHQEWISTKNRVELYGESDYDVHSPLNRAYTI